MHFRDILNGIDLIDRFLKDMAFEDYRDDLKTKSAVERQLQIIQKLRIDWATRRISYVQGLTGRVSWAWAIF